MKKCLSFFLSPRWQLHRHGASAPHLIMLLSLILFGLLSYSYCDEKMQEIIVRPGDTLWSISNTYLKDPKRWNELLKYNKQLTRDPSIALPGMVLKVPVKLIKEEYRAATLVSYMPVVLYRPSRSPDWTPVNPKMELFKDDALRTLVNGRAEIKFYTGEKLSLYPNTVAILRPPKKQTDIELLAGEVRGRSKILTATAIITPKTKNTEFGAKIKDDLTTLVQVYKGKADVEAQGKKVEVKEGFATEVKLDKTPSEPIVLPPIPEFETTDVALTTGSRIELEKTKTGSIVKFNGTTISVRIMDNKKKSKTTATSELKSPNVNVDDKKIDKIKIKTIVIDSNPIQGYHIQIAREISFTNIIFDKKFDALVDTINLSENLPPGTYWLRVSYIDLLGFEGKFNDPRQITIGSGRSR